MTRWEKEKGREREQRGAYRGGQSRKPHVSSDGAEKRYGLFKEGIRVGRRVRGRHVEQVDEELGRTEKKKKKKRQNGAQITGLRLRLVRIERAGRTKLQVIELAVKLGRRSSNRRGDWDVVGILVGGWRTGV